MTALSDGVGTPAIVSMLHTVQSIVNLGGSWSEMNTSKAPYQCAWTSDKFQYTDMTPSLINLVHNGGDAWWDG
jgi:hypothetical protein